MLHGTYDFVLFLIGGLNELYGVDNIYLDIASILLPVSITILGVIWAYLYFRRVNSYVRIVFYLFYIRLLRLSKISEVDGSNFKILTMWPNLNFDICSGAFLKF
jgi:hypothetical protein